MYLSGDYDRWVGVGKELPEVSHKPFASFGSRLEGISDPATWVIVRRRRIGRSIGYSAGFRVSVNRVGH
jgi:hypothetical protein